MYVSGVMVGCWGLGTWSVFKAWGWGGLGRGGVGVVVVVKVG